jgi:hypothetical protein
LNWQECHDLGIITQQPSTQTARADVRSTSLPGIALA